MNITFDFSTIIIAIAISMVIVGIALLGLSSIAKNRKAGGVFMDERPRTNRPRISGRQYLGMYLSLAIGEAIILGTAVGYRSSHDPAEGIVYGAVIFIVMILFYPVINRLRQR